MDDQTFRTIICLMITVGLFLWGIGSAFKSRD